MDPIVALAAALSGSAASRLAYNEWVKGGGFRVVVDVLPHTDTWMRGIRNVLVDSVGTKYVQGTHPLTKTRLRLPISILEGR